MTFHHPTYTTFLYIIAACKTKHIKVSPSTYRHLPPRHLLHHTLWSTTTRHTSHSNPPHIRKNITVSPLPPRPTFIHHSFRVRHLHLATHTRTHTTLASPPPRANTHLSCHAWETFDEGEGTNIHPSTLSSVHTNVLSLLHAGGDPSYGESSPV